MNSLDTTWWVRWTPGIVRFDSLPAHQMNNTYTILNALGLDDQVYPGHPIVIAYCITKVFNSLAEASSRKDREYPAALESGDINGASGNVYAGLDLLHRISLRLIHNNEPRTSAISAELELADRYWYNCDGQGKGGGCFQNNNYESARDQEIKMLKMLDRWADGQLQANFIKPYLINALNKWDLKK